MPPTPIQANAPKSAALVFPTVLQDRGIGVISGIQEARTRTLSTDRHISSVLNANRYGNDVAQCNFDRCDMDEGYARLRASLRFDRDWTTTLDDVPSSGFYVRSILVDGTKLYWAEEDSPPNASDPRRATLATRTLPSGTPQILEVFDYYLSRRPAFDAQFIYTATSSSFARGGDPDALTRVSRASGDAVSRPLPAFGFTSRRDRLIVAGGQLYLTGFVDPGFKQLKTVRLPLDAAFATTEAFDFLAEEAFDAELVDGKLLITTPSGVLRCPSPTSCATPTVVSLEGRLLAQDEKAVYWTMPDTYSLGTVYLLAK